MSSLIVEVCNVDDVKKHENSDSLDIVFIKNWQTIVRSGTYKAGDLCVYVPVDTLIPEKFAESIGITKYTKKYNDSFGEYRIVSASRIRNELSFGVVFKPENGFVLGQNVAELYGLKKYEPCNLSMGSDGVRSPSYFCKYTDIEHYGNYPDVFSEDDLIVVDEKIHGTNSRVMIHQNYDGNIEFVLGNRESAVKENISNGKKSLYSVPLTEGMKNMLSHLYNIHKTPIIAYGEIYGPKVQDMNYGVSAPSYRCYDISICGKYLPYREKINILQEFNIPYSPILYVGQFSKAVIKDMVVGETNVGIASKINGCSGREGIIIRSQNEDISPQIGRKILQFVSVDYYNRSEHSRRHNKTAIKKFSNIISE